MEFQSMRYLLMAIFTILPGVLGVLIFGYHALADWNGLQQAYIPFAKAVQSKSSLETLFVTEAMQNIQRINLFADGVWTLLSMIIASIGIHGICLVPRTRK
ncbi:hypothetical protein [Pseudanabaena sp. SR411]|uniref:hypothetical protein n=1 Tax=Pseudanabaena sp. SR411 TaxID=1980935 RepID=UPI0020CD4747|nr:hypothetical protein [Pseudanabaena sp. SR411]